MPYSRNAGLIRDLELAAVNNPRRDFVQKNLNNENHMLLNIFTSYDQKAGKKASDR